MQLGPPPARPPPFPPQQRRPRPSRPAPAPPQQRRSQQSKQSQQQTRRATEFAKLINEIVNTQIVYTDQLTDNLTALEYVWNWANQDLVDPNLARRLAAVTRAIFETLVPFVQANNQITKRLQQARADPIAFLELLIDDYTAMLGEYCTIISKCLSKAGPSFLALCAVDNETIESIPLAAEYNAWFDYAVRQIPRMEEFGSQGLGLQLITMQRMSRVGLLVLGAKKILPSDQRITELVAKSRDMVNKYNLCQDRVTDLICETVKNYCRYHGCPKLECEPKSKFSWFTPAIKDKITSKGRCPCINPKELKTGRRRSWLGFGSRPSRHQSRVGRRRPAKN
jgi:hypothetical protein